MASRRSDRTPDDVDAELRIVSAVRDLYGGSLTLTDELLDERNECLDKSPD